MKNQEPKYKFKKEFAWRPVILHIFPPSRLEFMWLRFFYAVYEKQLDGTWALFDTSSTQKPFKSSLAEKLIRKLFMYLLDKRYPA